MPNSETERKRFGSLSGRLTIDSDKCEIVVLAEESDMQMIILRVAATSLNQLFSSLRLHRAAITNLHAILWALGIGFTVDFAGNRVAVLGRDAHAGLFSKLVRVAPVELRVLPILRALMTSK